MAFDTKPLEAMAEQARSVPALVGNDEDMAAYNKPLTSISFTRYMTEGARVSQRPYIKDAKTNPERIGLISKANINTIKRQAVDSVNEAVTHFGEENVGKVVQEALRQCQFDQITFTHNPNHDGSSHAREDSFEAILKDKSLKAPSRRSRDKQGDATMISLGTHVRGEALTTEKTVFHLDGPIPASDIQRSLGVVTLGMTDDGRDTFQSLVVGGNQLREAWALATISNALRELTSTRHRTNAETRFQNMEPMIGYQATQTLSELKVPNEISLVGHHLSRDGTSEEITSGRAEKKGRKETPDTIEPDKGNPKLKRQPRGRAKEDN